LPILCIMGASQGENEMDDMEKMLENDDWMMDPTAVDWEDNDGQPDEHTEWQDVFGGDDFAEQWECDFGGEW